MYGTIPMNHGKGNMGVLEHSFYKVGPFLGNYLVSFFGIEGESILKYTSKQAWNVRTESGQFIETWYKNFMGYYRYKLSPTTQSVAFSISKSKDYYDFYKNYCFPCINPLNWLPTELRQKMTENQKLCYVIVDDQDNFNIAVCSKQSGAQSTDEIIYKLSHIMSRFIAEANVMRTKFLQCISYDFVKNTNTPKQRIPSYVKDIVTDLLKEENVPKPVLKQIPTTQNYSKIVDSGIIPIKTDMELNFQPLLSNKTVYLTPLESEYNIRRGKEKENGRIKITNASQINVQKHYQLKNPWSCGYLVSSNIVPNHVILEYTNNAISLWEKGYLNLLKKLRLQKSLSLEELNQVTYQNLCIVPMENEVWMDKYEYFTQKKMIEHQKKMFVSLLETGVHDLWYCSPFEWKRMHLTKSSQQSVPFCTDVLYNSNLKLQGFDTFDIIHKEMTHNTHIISIENTTYKKQIPNINLKKMKTLNLESRAVKWFSALLESGERRERILNDFKEHLPNFYNYLSTKTEFKILEHTVFIAFLYLVVFLSVKTSYIRKHIGTNTQVLIDRITELKHVAWFNTMNGNIEDFLQMHNKKGDYLFGLDINILPYIDRSVIYQCHMYLTCFLPLASWFHNQILNKKPITDTHVPLKYLYPWPEKSLDWLETPDIRKNIQNVNFWHGNVTSPEDAVTMLFQKSLPFRSQGRSMDRKVKHTCYENESVAHLMVILVRNTLMGTYSDVFLPACFNVPCPREEVNMFSTYYHIPLMYRPAFYTMMCLYDTFFHPSTLANEQKEKEIRNMLLAWGTRDSKISSTITKELLTNIMMLEPQYIKVQSTFDWKTVWFRNSTATNILRYFTDTKITNLHQQCIKSYTASDLLPKLPTNVQTSLFSKPSCILNQTSKISLNSKLFAEFKSYNEKLLISTIILSEEIQVIENMLQDPDLQKEEFIKVKEDYEKALEERKMALHVSQFELSDEKKQEIWITMFKLKENSIQTLTPQELKNTKIFNFLTDQEIVALFVIINHFIYNVSSNQIEDIMPNFTIVGFKTFFFVLKVLEMLDGVETYPLSAEDNQAIEQAMRRKFNITPDRPLPDTAYNVMYTYCCRRICNAKETKRNYGHEDILYNLYTHEYRCTKRKINKPQIFTLNAMVASEQVKNAVYKASIQAEQYKVSKRYLLEQSTEPQNATKKKQKKFTSPYHVSKIEPLSPNKNISGQIIDELIKTTMYKMPGEGWTPMEGIFSKLIAKAQYKIARSIIRQTEPNCLKKPEVLTINLKGKGLIYKKSDEAPKKYVHCHRCAHLHKYNDNYWYGSHYYCAHCWTELDLMVLECLYCESCKIKKMDKLSTVVHRSHHNCVIGDEILKREKEKEKQLKTRQKKNILTKHITEPCLEAYQLASDLKMVFDDRIDFEDYEKMKQRIKKNGTSFNLQTVAFTSHSREVMNTLYHNEITEYNLLHPSNEQWEKNYRNKSSGVGQSYSSSEIISNKAKKIIEKNFPKETKKKRKKNSVIPVSGLRDSGKLQAAKLEENESRYIVREAVMSDRSEKRKLIERSQRSLAKHGRFLVHATNYMWDLLYNSCHIPLTASTTFKTMTTETQFYLYIIVDEYPKKNSQSESTQDPYAGYELPIKLAVMCEDHTNLLLERTKKNEANRLQETYEPYYMQKNHIGVMLQKDIQITLKRPDPTRKKMNNS